MSVEKNILIKIFLPKFQMYYSNAFAKARSGLKVPPSKTFQSQQDFPVSDAYYYSHCCLKHAVQPSSLRNLLYLKDHDGLHARFQNLQSYTLREKKNPNTAR